MSIAARFAAMLLLVGASACATSIAQSRHEASRAIISIVPRPRSMRLYQSDPPARLSAHIRFARAPLPAEAYSLTIDKKGATIRAASDAGFAYGLTTLKQIAMGDSPDRLQIQDRPMYRWRGLHLDVSRHFFSVPIIERYIALAAHYKLNVFHWHLTDDQAWRLQIKRYPALTSGVSCRDNACEFYTQADVRRIVRFAKSRNITVVPEIEMPAHATAALRAYPQLGCGSAGVICPRESAVAFLENVLVEVMRLFPSRYIHVGGDEAPVSTERYLMPRIEAFLHAHGRAMVGWDDILGSGVSRKTVIMAWNGERRAIAAISAGHDVVMVPDGPLYFDAYQGARSQEPPATQHMATLEEVYSYDPTPDGLSGEQRSHILGAEAALWTEKIASPNRLFAMALPRAIALSEIAWTPPAQKSWRSFLSRLPAQLAWLRANGYSFRTPSPMIDVIGRRMRFQSMPGNVSGAIALTDQSAATVRLNEPLKGVEIRYTLDGTAPTARSALYGSPLNLRLDRGSQTVTAAAFDARGEVSESSSVVVKRLAPSAFKRTNGSRAWGSIVSP